MGLDSYIIRKRRPRAGIEAADPRECLKHWVDNPGVHKWVWSLYKRRTDVQPDINMVDISLYRKNLLSLRKYLTSPKNKHDATDLSFLDAAADALMAGDSVVYFSKYTRPEDMKAEGKCPWSGGELCRRAPLCIMAAPEACVHLIQNRVGACSMCEEANGPCAGTFLCFLDVQDAERRAARRKRGY